MDAADVDEEAPPPMTIAIANVDSVVVNVPAEVATVVAV